MLILLDCRPLQLTGLDSEKSRLIASVVTALSEDPGVQWLLVGNRAGPLPDWPGTRLVTCRVLPGKLGWRLWYDVEIPRLAKKYKATLVMTTGGVAAKTPLQQYIWMPERANPKEGRSYPPLYAGRLLESMRRATILLGYSDRDRNWLAGVDAGAAEKLIVLHPSPMITTTAGPLSISGREEAKAEFARGREYFLADAAAAGEEGLIYLLKAFSLFKRRQHSNLQLVIRGIPDGSLRKRLETYKYREDVHWSPPSGPGNDRLTAGAYAYLFLFEGNTLGGTALDAWKSGVPVIGRTGGLLQDLAGGAILTVDGADPAALAERLMSVYKDEQLRDRLIGLGKTRVEDFDPEHTAGLLRSIIGPSV